MEFVEKNDDNRENYCSNSSQQQQQQQPKHDNLENNKNINEINMNTTNDKSTDSDKEISKNKKVNIDNTIINSDCTTNHPTETVDFKVIYNKEKIDITLSINSTIAELKDYLQKIISVPKEMQKVMIKGLAKDHDTLKDLGVTKGTKVMIVGSKLDDVLALSNTNKEEKQDEAAGGTSKVPLLQQKIHRKILDKGIPEDVMPGILDAQEPLPDFPLSGMLNKAGGKVRLTFKLEQDQLWIGTKERTDKLSMNAVKSILSYPVPEHPEYHVMSLQLGTTDASIYWVYWVPAQYIAAIKDAVLGKWCYF